MGLTPTTQSENKWTTRGGNDFLQLVTAEGGVISGWIDSTGTPRGTLAGTGGGSGVASLNTLTGAVTLAAGSNITLTPVGNTITIASSGGGGTPGGTDTQVQFNDGGSFGGNSNFTFNKTLSVLTIGDNASAWQSQTGFTKALNFSSNQAPGVFTAISLITAASNPVAAANSTMNFVSSHGTLASPSHSLNGDNGAEIDFWGFNTVDGYAIGVYMNTAIDGDWTTTGSYPMSLHLANGTSFTDIFTIGVTAGGASTVGFFNAAPVVKQTVTGVKLPSDTVMASLLTALSNYGFITNSTT